ncbi:MAG: exodeoxyribonuclease VII large subunit [Bacteroidales bacterium]|nr:exodeoxyribonuclease VII large subunit [Bacteroidales bacterium]
MSGKKRVLEREAVRAAEITVEAVKPAETADIAGSSVETRRVFNLIDVCNSIHKTLSARYGSAFWLRAEMHKLNYYPPSGHCFPELCQKADNRILAEMRATLWSADYRRISAQFERTTGESLQEGTELLMQVTIQYEPKYGLSLHILDIDPVFTLGNLQRQRIACVARLKKENLWTAQQALPFPLLPKRVAVISAVSSKGYSDFMRVLESRSDRYVFQTDLFTALLQGDASVDSILKALRHIERHKTDYDVVAVVRGGGGEVGLSGFDRYELASAVASFPLPILTGIGHSTNLTVTEEVAYYNGITPTQVGEFLIESFAAFERALEVMTQNIVYSAENILCRHWHFLERVNEAGRAALRICRNETRQLEAVEKVLPALVVRKIRWERQQLAQWEKWLRAVSPEKILQRGFAYVYNGDRIVKDAAALRPGHPIRICFRKGEVEAEVIKTL